MEMKNLKVTFNVLDDRSNILVGCDKASGHLAFDVHMPIERKDRWVKDGHRTLEPEWSTFARVMSRTIIHIALTHVALNEVPIRACDTQNFCLQAPSSKNAMLFVVQILD